MQPVTEGQQTPRSSPYVPPTGTGTDCSVQVLPFHDSANGREPVYSTARQRAAEGQETPSKVSWRGFGGVGMGWMVQLVPSQCSASVCSPLPSAVPTAVQLFGESQETASSADRNVPAGLGVDWACHLLPSHRSASGTPSGALAVACPPTARHSRADGQETAESPVLWAPAGTGLCLSAHALPFQNHTSALRRPVPTAMQIPAAWHETPAGRPCVMPAGSGIGSRVHPAAAFAAPVPATVRASAAVSPVRYRFMHASGSFTPAVRR